MDENQANQTVQDAQSLLKSRDKALATATRHRTLLEHLGEEYDEQLVIRHNLELENYSLKAQLSDAFAEIKARDFRIDSLLNQINAFNEVTDDETKQKVLLWKANARNKIKPSAAEQLAEPPVDQSDSSLESAT